MKHTKLLAAAAGAGILFAGAAAAMAFSPNDYSLFDGAAYASPGNASARAVALTSDATTTDSGIDYALGGSYTFADIQNLATDYEFTAGSCGGGSPRFQINLQTASGTKNAFVYIGPPPNYTNCPTGVWTNTGNLIGASSTIDTSQLPGGAFYDSYSAALAKYGSYPVTGIQLVADGGWAFPATGQTVLVDNTQINSTTYTYEIPTPSSKQACLHGGWENLADNNGHLFKNQGDCVSYVTTQGKNQAAGK